MFNESMLYTRRFKYYAIRENLFFKSEFPNLVSNYLYGSYEKKIQNVSNISKTMAACHKSVSVWGSGCYSSSVF